MPGREPVDPDYAAAAPREGGKRGAADDAEADDCYVVGHAGRSRGARLSVAFDCATASRCALVRSCVACRPIQSSGLVRKSRAARRCQQRHCARQAQRRRELAADMLSRLRSSR
jgi:hypothetical protein